MKSLEKISLFQLMRADETGHAIYLMECQAGGWNLPSKIYLILMSRTLLSLVQLLIEK